MYDWWEVASNDLQNEKKRQEDYWTKGTYDLVISIERAQQSNRNTMKRIDLINSERLQNAILQNDHVLCQSEPSWENTFILAFVKAKSFST